MEIDGSAERKRKDDEHLRRALEEAWDRKEKPVRSWLKFTAWRDAIVPGARSTWRFIVVATPLWIAITALATAVMAWKMLRP